MTYTKAQITENSRAYFFNKKKNQIRNKNHKKFKNTTMLYKF